MEPKVKSDSYQKFTQNLSIHDVLYNSFFSSSKKHILVYDPSGQM